MSVFNYKEYEVYYEIHGSGEPILILNGIMMSTNSWANFKDEFTKKNQLILVDLLDQGKSSKLEGIEYDLDLQVEMIKSFLDEINVQKINLFGISYGGEVALQFAVKYTTYLTKLLLFNTVAYTNPWLKEIGIAWNKATYDAEAYYATTIPVIYSPSFYVEHSEAMAKRKELLLTVFNNKTFINSMIRLTNSANNHDVRDLLHTINVPTLVVGSEYDFITPSYEQFYIHEKIKGSSYMIIPNAGHASMYEKPTLFASLVLGFINSNQMHFSI